MLTEKQIKTIEQRLNDSAEVYYDSRNTETKSRCRGDCQGIAFVLAEIGYAVEWDNGKAIIVEND